MSAALDAAAKAGDAVAVAQLLAKEADAAAAAGAALPAAAAAGHGAVMRALHAAGAKPGADLLQLAARSGSAEACGAAVDLFGAGVAGAAAAPALLAAAESGGESLTFLLERGVDPNVQGEGGATALLVAARRKAVEDVKTLVLFGAVPSGGGESPQAAAGGDAAVVKEIERGALPKDKAEKKAAAFKAQGNKVFQEGEFVKGAKFYSLSIAYDPSNHVLFSNRSACFFNLRKLDRALADATHCVRLKPDWPKGYFRKGACLHQLEDLEGARQTYDAGLKIDPKQRDLVKAKEDLAKDLREREKKAAKAP